MIIQKIHPNAAQLGTKGGIIRNKWLHGRSKGGNAINLCKWLQPHQALCIEVPTLTITSFLGTY